MKKYLLFGGSEYYPEGGVDDLIGSFGTIADAQEFWESSHWVKEERARWHHIVEYATMKKVAVEID